MAVIFPSTPTIGDQFTPPGLNVTYTYVGDGQWVTTDGPVQSGATGATGAQGFGIYAYARTTPLGVLISSNGLTVTRLTTGTYQYTLTQPYGSSDYGLTGNAIEVTAGIANVEFDNITSNSFTLEIVRNNSSLADEEHTVTVFGVDGPTGSGSAYQSWRNTVNPVGTEAQFVAYNIGATGLQGLQGPAGADSTIPGPPGPTGPAGSDGTSVSIQGTVPDANALVALSGSADPGDLYIVLASGSGYTAGDGAVRNDNSGAPSLLDWDNVGPLRGPDGPQGATGLTGPVGPDGPDGPTGPGTGGFFCITGERGSSPGTNQYFAFGNGDSAANGVVIAEDCEMSTLTIGTENPTSGNMVVGAYFISDTGAATFSGLSATVPTGQRESTTATGGGININAGDRIAIRCIQSGGGNGTVANVWFVTSGARGATGLDGPPGPSGGATGSTGAQGFQGATGSQGLTGPEGPQGPIGLTGPEGPQGPLGPQGLQGATGLAGTPGSGITLKGTVPTVGDLPAVGNLVGDLYIVTATNDGYAWDGTQWNNVGPIAGPQGATGAQGLIGPTGATGALVTPYCKVDMLNSSTINSGVQDVFTDYGVLNVTPLLASSGDFSFSANGITVNNAGIYVVSATMEQQSNTARTNVAMKFTIDGVEQPEVAAMGYIRSSNGQNESSVTMAPLYQLTTSQVVNTVFARYGNAGIVNLRGAASSLSIYKIANLP